MVVPTGHPIGGTAFVAAQLNWTFFHLGTWIGGVECASGLQLCRDSPVLLRLHRHFQLRNL